MDTEKARNWLRLRLTPGVGGALASSLISRFGSVEGVAAASAADLASVGGMNREKAEALSGRAISNLCDDQVARAEKLGIDIVTPDDAAYPEALRNIPSPPMVLFVRGTLEASDERAVAVVGSRTSTLYGQRVAESMGAGLAGFGITVVSGLARGIDTAAHRGALSRRGRTLAVLGSGVDRVYPPENQALARKIAAAGAVLSDFPLGTGPARHHFPMRNRIISGLVRGVVVVEAHQKSGALITAGAALDQGREVFAVPGNITNESSAGCNLLIRDGAHPFTNLADLLAILDFSSEGAALPEFPGPVPCSPASVLDERQSLVLRSLREHEAHHIDQMAHTLNLESSALSGILFQLELRDLVRELPGKRFIRA